jgi:hypothetical protein
MSAPTRQFHRLSIGRDMAGTRAQARTARAAGPDPSDDDSDHDDGGNDSSLDESSSEAEESDDESTSASAVLAGSGITYNLAQLDSESEARALVGLTGQFDVVNCRATRSGYEFQLSDRPQVHLGPDSYICTCPTFQGRPDVACQHIFVGSPPTTKGR